MGHNLRLCYSYIDNYKHGYKLNVKQAEGKGGRKKDGGWLVGGEDAQEGTDVY